MIWQSWSQKYGNLLGLRLGSINVVVVTGIELIREVSNREVFEGRPDGFFYTMRSFGKKLGKCLLYSIISTLLRILSKLPTSLDFFTLHLYFRYYAIRLILAPVGILKLLIKCTLLRFAFLVCLVLKTLFSIKT